MASACYTVSNRHNKGEQSKVIFVKQNMVNKVLANSPEPHIDGVIVIDQQGLIQVFDDDAQTLLGYKAEEIIGKPLTLLMSSQQGATHPSYVNQAVKAPPKTHRLHSKRTIIGKDKYGELIPLAITVTADTSSPDIRFIGVLQDLRKHEERLTEIFHDFDRTTQALNQRIQFDALLNQHSNRLLSSHEDEFIPVMEKVLQSIGDFLSFDHCFILKFDDDLCHGSLWCEWRRSACLMKSFPKHFSIPNSEVFLNAFSKTDTLILSNRKNQPPEDAILFDLASHMSPNGFVYSRITPIQSKNDTPAGCIGFSILDPKHQPSELQISLLGTATQLLINAWGRHQLILIAREAEQNLVSANRVLSQQALHDALTGLPNRRAFDHGLRQEFDRAKRHNSGVCLLMCDIDFFKHYNDFFGHSKGDFCLQQVAKILQNTFNRAGELCTRFGGEEFAIILPSINRAEATDQAQRLLDNLRAAEIPHAHSSQQPYLTISIGIAQFSTDQPYSNMEELIEAADKALYDAKENGRNQLAWAKEAE